MDDRMTPAGLRARFAELSAQRAEILGASTPLRDQRDAISAVAQSQITTIDAQVREMETGLFDIDQERALIARALGGRTGDTPDFPSTGG